MSLWGTKTRPPTSTSSHLRCTGNSRSYQNSHLPVPRAGSALSDEETDVGRHPGSSLRNDKASHVACARDACTLIVLVGQRRDFLWPDGLLCPRQDIGMVAWAKGGQEGRGKRVEQMKTGHEAGALDRVARLHAARLPFTGWIGRVLSSVRRCGRTRAGLERWRKRDADRGRSCTMCHNPQIHSGCDAWRTVLQAAVEQWCESKRAKLNPPKTALPLDQAGVLSARGGAHR